MARFSSSPWLALEVYNGRTVESIHSSDPDDFPGWIRVIGSRQVRTVSLLMPDQQMPHKQWAHVHVVAVWQASDTHEIYFEDAEGAAWLSSGVRCTPPKQHRVQCLWKRAVQVNRKKVLQDT